jgi:hypothetical protein
MQKSSLLQGTFHYLADLNFTGKSLWINPMRHDHAFAKNHCGNQATDGNW